MASQSVIQSAIASQRLDTLRYEYVLQHNVQEYVFQQTEQVQGKVRPLFQLMQNFLRFFLPSILLLLLLFLNSFIDSISVEVFCKYKYVMPSKC